MSTDFESRVRKTGMRLYELVEGETPSLFQRKYWMGKMMDWCMRHEDFKVELFRFIDVFPCLTDPTSVAKHMKEYFLRPDQNFPRALQFTLGSASATSLGAKMMAKGVASNIETMGKQFIAGATPQNALPAIEDVRSKGMAFSVDLLGEAVISETEAEAYLERYLELFDILNSAQKSWKPLGSVSGDLDWGYSPKINVSIKPSAMYSQMDPCAFDYSISKAKERLRPIFRKAVETGAHVFLDMEHYDLKNLTLGLFRSLTDEPEFRDYPYTGIVVQAYLKNSEADLKELIGWARRRKERFSIRLVKGAYWDVETVHARQRNWPVPVFTRKPETDANFEKLAHYIMENHQWVDLACASQNIRSIACVMEMSEKLGVPRERLEYQILYGMAEPVRNALRKAGLPLRLYIPLGKMIPGMAYLVRRLLENTSNESFLRQNFAEGVSREELLRNPLESLENQPVSPVDPTLASEYGTHGPFRNEPLRDWTLAEHREPLQGALKKVRKAFPYECPLYIGGKKIVKGKKIRSTNPNNPEEVVGIVASAGKEELELAVAAAKEAFPPWRDRDPKDRAKVLFEGAAVARKMRDELTALQVYEVGKTWSEADADVCEAIDFLEYYGREMIRLATPRRMGTVPGETSHLFYEPRGVSAVIAPWNFPLAISMGMTCAALVAGNTVLYKPSSQSCVTGSMIYEIFKQTRLPQGALNFLSGSGSDIGDDLVTHPEVALVAFTGSMEVGLRIVELAGKTGEGVKQVKTVVVEMGGKNAIIVDEDADLDEAIPHILQSAFGYQGQKCSACSRVIVLAANYDLFVKRLRAAAESLVIGPPEDPKNFMGAVIDAEAERKILRYIEIGKEEGSLLLERDLPGVQGHFVPLTIFTGIQSEHAVAQEEVFGPLLAVIKVGDFVEALRVANDTRYALAGALFSRSPENIAEAKKKFRVGNLYVNRGCTGALVERHPFGGFKMSGIGSKAGGPDYLLQFMVPRNVVENTLRRGFAPTEQ